MDVNIPNNPYLLLTPGPLSTSKPVRKALLQDWCTWDRDYGDIVQEIRIRLVKLAGASLDDYTSVLMQGSGTFSVESVFGSVIGDNDKVLILTNGAYGKRMVEIADVLRLNFIAQDSSELLQPHLQLIEGILTTDRDITHVAFVHCETTTGMLNPLSDLCSLAKKYNKKLIVDAMSSFGGIPIDIPKLEIDFLISSANKCIQGVPGFGFIIARRQSLELVSGKRRSLSLDLYNQWKSMEEHHGKWRFTSPTHTVRAFLQALYELEKEGGIEIRHQRYQNNQQILVQGMQKLGFKTLLMQKLHSPIITTFLSPNHPSFNFQEFYQRIKQNGFVIYPGKVTDYNCFRIGNIGEVYSADMHSLLLAVKDAMYWENTKVDQINTKN